MRVMVEEMEEELCEIVVEVKMLGDKVRHFLQFLKRTSGVDMWACYPSW